MAKTVFSAGSPVTAAFLNAINNPSFVPSPNNDGEIEQINDSMMTNSPGNIKPEWQSFRDAFKVSAGSGLSISYVGGIIRQTDGDLLTVVASNLALPNNTTVYIVLNNDGTVTHSTIYPLTGIPIAQVITAAGAVTSVVDFRNQSIRDIYPLAQLIRLFGGNGGEGAKTATNGEVFDRGEYYFASLTIPLGATVTISQGAVFNVAGDVTIAGVVNVTTASQGGSPKGVGGALSGLRSGGLPGQGPGAGSGPIGGTPYNYSLTPFGSGGAGGRCQNCGIIVDDGGNGGGGLIIRAAGTVTVSGSIVAQGGDAVAQGDTPTGASPVVAGAGGGSGGLIYLSSLKSVVVSGVLDVRGGDGSNATYDLASAGDGGGGGGGYVVIVAPTINTTGSTIQLAGGTSRGNAGGGTRGGGGGAYGGAGGAGNGSAGNAGQTILRYFTPIA